MRPAFATVALVAAVAASGCGRVPGDIDAAKAEPESGWTSLGNRELAKGPIAAPHGKADAQWSHYDPPDLFAGAATQDVQYVTAPDGTQLAVYLTLPADAQDQPVPGRYPTVLSFTGYNVPTANGGARSYFVRHGYAMVVADARGTGRSSGEWEAFGPNEQADFGPVIDWITQQDWSDGRIANFGESYVGITALMAASQQHPAIKAVFSEIAVSDIYRDLAFAGGEFSTVFMPGWLALVTAGHVSQPDKLQDPQYDAALIQRLIALPGSFQSKLLLGALSGDPEVVYDGPFAAERSTQEKTANIRVPTFLTAGLYDIFQRGVPLNYERIKANAPVKMLVGPWHHTSHGSGLPADGVPPVDRIALRWFDHYVKGMEVGADTLPDVTQYVAGHGHYVTSSDWPHPQARAQSLYLRGDGSLSDEPPAAGEAPRYTVQQPLNGLCDFNSLQWSAGLAGNLPLQCLQNNNNAYRTELVYETAPYEQDVYINGPLQADIWVSTTALDAAVSIRVDDFADGTGTQVSSGIQVVSLRAVDESRSRYLDGQMIQPWHPFTQESAQAVTPGTAVMVPVEIFPTSALIAKGHTLRMSISSSDLIRSFMPLPMLASGAAGVMTLHSAAERPSRLVLPVVPASELGR